MAVNGPVLAQLIRTKMEAKFKNVMPYAGPLAQNNPSYFIQFCDAIGNGLIESTPVITFNTVDSGLRGAPIVGGTGSGVGIIVDTDWFTKRIYEEIRTRSAATYGSTSHPVWCDDWDIFNDPFNPLPPSHCSLNKNQYNPYNFLTALSEAISEGVTEHYETFRILQSTHTSVYVGSGQIQRGGYYGIDSNAVKGSIQSLGPLMAGSFWPLLCEAIGVAYARAIMEESTGSVVIVGSCSAGSGQACGLPGSGVGMGTAT